jgi:6-pyruvoyltetrahydropterin/6-carboxytetrahydropterin synthase
MYTISKEFHFEASHLLHLPYESKCTRMHGHSYRVVVELESDQLDGNGMVVDFTDLGEFGDYIADYVDHRHLNGLVAQPTAENIAHFFYQIVKTTWAEFKVTVKVSETAKTWVTYTE